MKIEISSISNLGHGIGFDKNGKKIFIPKSITGDVVEAEVVKKSNKFTLAKIVKIDKESALRQKAECEYFSKCGGCSLQHFKNDFYQNFKKKNITDLLVRNDIEFSDEIKFVEVGKNSRRRVTFQITNNDLGFFKESSHDLIKINHCLMLTEELGALIPNLQKLLKELPLNFVKQISACQFDNVIDIVFELTKEELSAAISKKLAEFTASNKNINLSYKKGGKVTPIYRQIIPQLNLENIIIDAPSDIFLQATKKGQETIIAEIMRFIDGKNIKNVIDLYCGIGTYSFALSHLKTITKITAIEGKSSMVGSIKHNIKAHNLTNKISAKKQDIASNPIQADQLKGYDLAIINPPRTGAKSQIVKLINSNVKNVIIASCDLNSFMKDAKILIANGFRLEKMTAIDQFYYTAHIELITIFVKTIKTQKSASN